MVMFHSQQLAIRNFGPKERTVSLSETEMDGTVQIQCKLSTLQFKLKQHLLLFHSSKFQDVLITSSTCHPVQHLCKCLWSVHLDELKWSSVRFAFGSPASHMQFHITLWPSLCGPLVQLPPLVHNQSVNKKLSLASALDYYIQ